MVNGAMGLPLNSNFAESSASVVLRVGREESPKPSSRPAAANGSSGGAGASTLGGSGSATGTGGAVALPFTVGSSINGVGASISTDELIAAGSDTPEESKPSKSISGAGATAGGGGAAGANEVVGC